jgi:hypothetical protein
MKHPKTPAIAPEAALVAGHPAHIPAEIFRAPDRDEPACAGTADLRHDDRRLGAVGEALKRAPGDDEQCTSVLHATDEEEFGGIIADGWVGAQDVRRHLGAQAGQERQPVRRDLMNEIIDGGDAVGGRHILHNDGGAFAADTCQ